MWVSFGLTESGDDLQPIVWDKKPTDKQVDREYKKLYPDEYEHVGFVNHSTLKAVECMAQKAK